MTWKKALSSPRPPYPKSAEKDRVEGVSVCQLEIDENGVVSDVEVLEIPHESVRASLTNTLQKWRFSTTRYHGEPVRLTGKLTFYFLRPSGRGCVLSANEYLEAKRKGAPSLTKMCEPGG